MPLNTLPYQPLGFRFTTETQSYWQAAVAPSTTPMLRTRSRRLFFYLELYEGGTYAAAKAKADKLAADPQITDVDVSLFDRETESFNVIATRKVPGAWSDWA